MELPEDDGHDVDDEQWEAVRETLGSGDVEPPTEQERAALMDAVRRAR